MELYKTTNDFNDFYIIADGFDGVIKKWENKKNNYGHIYKVEILTRADDIINLNKKKKYMYIASDSYGDKVYILADSFAEVEKIISSDEKLLLGMVIRIELICYYDKIFF